MSKFTGLPALPVGSAGVNPALMTLLAGVIENLNLLTGARDNGSLAAVTRNQFASLPNVSTQNMKVVSATGQGVNFNGYNFPLLEDYNKLGQDVQQLANDVATLKQELQNVISSLKGS
jgi:hypothetical protein